MRPRRDALDLEGTVELRGGCVLGVQGNRDAREWMSVRAVADRAGIDRRRGLLGRQREVVLEEDADRRRMAVYFRRAEAKLERRGLGRLVERVSARRDDLRR